jgi:hypothetical protein
MSAIDTTPTEITAMRSTTASTKPIAHKPASLARPQTLGRVIASEWIKLRTLRSTWLGHGAAVLLLIGIGAIAAAVSIGSVTPPDDGGPGFGGTSALDTVLTGANFGVLLLGVLGCLVGAREYGSRMITATIAASPRRWRVPVAKTVTLTGVALPTALIGVFGAFGVGMAILANGDVATFSLGDDGVLRTLVGMALYLTAVSLLGLALGVLLRSAAGSIGVLVGGLLILPGIAGALLPDGADSVLQVLPTNAASAFTAVQGDTTMGALGGALTLAVWVVAALVGATVAILRRDV